MTMTLKDLIEGDKNSVITIGNLRIDRLSPAMLNVMNTDSSLTQPELDTFRVMLAEAGYRETESWIATQGASWLSGGMFAGVSMRITRY